MVSGTLLQRPITLVMGGNRYSVPQPTLGTLVLVSELAAELPKVESTDSFTYHAVLSKAKYSKVLGRIMATFILGAKRINGGNAFIIRRKIKRLSGQILDTCRPSDIHAALLTIMKNTDAKDFFSITTFLEGASLTAPRKVVETTARGQ